MLPRLASQLTRKLENAHYMAFLLLLTSLAKADAQLGMWRHGV